MSSIVLKLSQWGGGDGCTTSVKTVDSENYWSWDFKNVGYQFFANAYPCKNQLFLTVTHKFMQQNGNG